MTKPAARKLAARKSGDQNEPGANAMSGKFKQNALGVKTKKGVAAPRVAAPGRAGAHGRRRGVALRAPDGRAAHERPERDDRKLCKPPALIGSEKWTQGRRSV